MLKRLGAKVAASSVGAVSALLLAAAPVRAEPALWVVKDADSTVYLFGTVHVLRPDVVWNTPAVRAAMADSRELWLEIADVDDPAAMAPLVQKYALDLQRPLSSKLTPEQNAKLRAAAARYGLQPAALEPMKPWFAGLTLSVLPLKAAGYDENAGVDKLLKAAAVKEGDQVKAFETVEEQLRFFDTLPEAQQVDFLVKALDDAEEGVAVLDKLAAAWARGDVKVIEAELAGEMKAEAPALYDRLLTQRNRNWADRIEAMMKGSGTHFVAVGAGHLAGPDSVQAQLKARGIEASRQ